MLSLNAVFDVVQEHFVMDCEPCELTEYAAECDAVRSLEYLVAIGKRHESAADIGCEVDHGVFVVAVANGALGALTWARANLPPCECDELCTVAAEHGHSAMLHLLHGRMNQPLHEETYRAAAARGDQAMVDWLRAHNCPGSQQGMAASMWV